MTLCVGDHLVIKRGGKILTGAEEAHHEFEVLDTGYMNTCLVWADGTPVIDNGEWWVGKQLGVDYFTRQTIKVRVVK